MGYSSSSSSYMPHINGLRALAILGVLVYHLRAAYCPAGYFGVDLFLVISGFLLFRSLLKPGVEQGFHYGSFLQKKAWRILPAWFIVTIVVCALCLYLFYAARVEDILKTARYSSVFIADYFIDHNGDYFNVFSQQNPFLHYWYLSITEQLYFIAPLLIIPLARWRSRRAAIILLVALSAVSLLYYVMVNTSGLISTSLRSMLYSCIGAKSAYYHLVPRLWEIAAGAGVLLLPELSNRAWLRHLLGVLGLAGIVVSFYLYQTGSPAVYLTVLSSLLCLRYASGGPAAWLLSLKPVQVLGTISFSLYLCHWPVMVIWKYCVMDVAGPWDEVGMVVLSLLLGALLWWGVERRSMPACRPGWRNAVLRFSVLLTIPVVLLCAMIGKNYLREQQKAETDSVSLRARIVLLHDMVHENDEAVTRGNECLAESGIGTGMLRMGTADVPPSFLLIGDSHGTQLYQGLHEYCSPAGIRGIYHRSSVSPYWHLALPPEYGDTSWWSYKIGESFLTYLKQHPEIKFVLLAQYWEMRLLPMNGTDERTGEALKTEELQRKMTAEGLGEWCDRLRAQGVMPIILGDNPFFDTPSPWDEWHRLKHLKLTRRQRVVTQEEHDRKQHHSHQLHRELAEAGRAIYIDLAPALKVKGVYPAMLDGEFLYLDENHLSLKASRMVAQYLVPQLKQLIEQTGQQGAAPAPECGASAAP